MKYALFLNMLMYLDGLVVLRFLEEK
jgi:hypothetical protein